MTSVSAPSHTISHPMVSYPQPTDNGLVRRPPSVNSRGAITRRHRNSRSHAGGTSYQPQNEFPHFSQTGDVDIVINADGQERTYMLHRLILAQCSGFFEASTSEDWPGAQARGQLPESRVMQSNALPNIRENEETGLGVAGSALIRPPGQERPRWRYELDWGNNDDEVPMLVKKPPTSTLFGGDPAPRPPPVPHKPHGPSTGFFRSMANFSAMQSASHIPHIQPQPDQGSDMIRDYDNLFRIFYNFSPALDSINIAESYMQCKTLLALADMYDALEVVGPRIDHHLLQFQSRLWKQIAKYPPSYLKLGFLARSKVIFSEAMIHVVGQWPSGSSQLKHNVPQSVLDIIEDKVEDLKEKRAKIEGQLFRLTLTTAKGERVSPTNAYADWLALSLFRQWIAENTTPPPPISKSSQPTTADSRRPTTTRHHPPPLSTGNLYRLLGAGGSSYLGHEETKRFLRIRPEDYSRDNLRKFEKRMDEIKNMARDIVKPLLKNCLELDLGRDGGGLGYLTCTSVDETDFPWD